MPELQKVEIDQGEEFRNQVVGDPVSVDDQRLEGFELADGGEILRSLERLARHHQALEIPQIGEDLRKGIAEIGVDEIHARDVPIILPLVDELDRVGPR